jgi:hypothetical protein
MDLYDDWAEMTMMIASSTFQALLATKLWCLWVLTALPVPELADFIAIIIALNSYLHFSFLCQRDRRGIAINEDYIPDQELADCYWSKY